MKLFSKQESVLFLNPNQSNPFPRPFLLKKKTPRRNLKQKFSQFYFPPCKISIFRGIESQELAYEEWEKN